MTSPHRRERLDALLVAEINRLLLKEIELPLGTIATIMRVKTDPEGEKANVYVSVFPFAKRAEVMERLKRATGHLQYLLNHRLRMEYVPAIFFVFDDSNESADKVERLIDEVAKEIKKDTL